MIRAECASPLGVLTLVSDGEALIGLYFENHKVGGPPVDAMPGEDKITRAAARELEAYFSGKRQAFSLPLKPRGTSFQQNVWRALQTIASGQTRTYSEIAHAIGAPKAVRAVGAAIGRNPISILIPCHRVLGASGALTGFAGGVERKRALLALEAAPRSVSAKQVA